MREIRLKPNSCKVQIHRILEIVSSEKHTMGQYLLSEDTFLNLLSLMGCLTEFSRNDSIWKSLNEMITRCHLPSVHNRLRENPETGLCLEILRQKTQISNLESLDKMSGFEIFMENLHLVSHSESTDLRVFLDIPRTFRYGFLLDGIQSYRAMLRFRASGNVSSTLLSFGFPSSLSDWIRQQYVQEFSDD